MDEYIFANSKGQINIICRTKINNITVYYDIIYSRTIVGILVKDPFLRSCQPYTVT